MQPTTTGSGTHTRRTHRPGRYLAGAAVALGAGALLVPTIVSGSARNTVGSGAAAAAVQRPFLATLTGAAEVPGPGDTDGTGAAAVTIDAATGEICADLRVDNIAAASMAHIHRGAVGVAGPVEVTLTPPASGSSSACTTATPTLAAEIVANPAGFYVNVHNADFPNGAVRGQLAASTATVGSMQLLAEPLRAYDSRQGTDGPITVGQTRTISLATGVNGAGTRVMALPPGATGAIVRLTVTDSVGAGFLKLYSAALTTEPATSAANWYQTNSIVGSDATVAVDAQGRVKVTAGVNSTHFVIDVVGYIF
jgi:hypothetical protein